MAGRSFRTGSTGNAPTSQTAKDEVYNLSGLNMVMPDQIIDTATRRFNKKLLGASPYTINSRMLSRNDTDKRVAILTRRGSITQFGLESSADTPLDIKQTGSLTSELMFSSAQAVASPITVPAFSLSYGGYAFSLLNLHIRKTSGYIESILVQIYTDSSGSPGTLIATSSVDSTLVGASQSVVLTRFMDAPAITTGQALWMVLQLVGSTTAKCYVGATATSGGLTKDLTVAGKPWVASGTRVVFTAPAYRSGSILGAFRRNVVGETPSTIVATGYGDLIKFDNSSVNSVIYAYAPGFNLFSNKFHFVQEDNYTIFCNGSIQPSYYDGSTVTALTNAPAAAEHIFIWKSSLMARVGNRFSFTDVLSTLANTNSWPAVNFFYPSTPEDPDKVYASIVFQDNLIMFTRRTKYVASMTGNDITTFSSREIKGTKGCLSQELVATDGDFIYFVATDGRMYRFNGVSDQLISDPVEPEITSVQDSSLYGYLHIYANQVRYYYAKSPSTEVSRMLLYDITYDEWFLDTGRSVCRSIAYDLEDNRLVEFSGKTTAAYRGDQSNYSDMGKPIDFKYWTNYKAYGSGAAKKRIRRFRPILQVSGRRFTMSIGKDSDFANRPDMRPYLVSGGGATFGDGSKFGDGTIFGGNTIVSNPAGMSGRAKHLQYRFEKNGVNTPVQLYGYIALFKEGTNK